MERRAAESTGYVCASPRRHRRHRSRRNRNKLSEKQQQFSLFGGQFAEANMLASDELYRQRAVVEQRLVDDFEQLLPKYLVFLEDPCDSEGSDDVPVSVDEVVVNLLNTINVAQALHKDATTVGFFDTRPSFSSVARW